MSLSTVSAIKQHNLQENNGGGSLSLYDLYLLILPLDLISPIKMGTN